MSAHTYITPPRRFLVWCPERDQTSDDAEMHETYSHERAAELWAEREDRHSADYLIVQEKWTPVVCVKLDGDEDADAQRFQVSGYTTAEYTAKGVT